MQNWFFCLSRKYKANKKFHDFFVSELSICLQLSRKESFGSSCFVMSIITAFLSLFCATLLLSLIASQTSIKIELLWHAKSVKNTLSQPFLLLCVCMVTRNKHLLRAHFWKVKDFYVSKFFPITGRILSHSAYLLIQPSSKRPVSKANNLPLTILDPSSFSCRENIF